MFMRLALIEAKRQPLALVALALLTFVGTTVLASIALAGQFVGQEIKQLVHGAAMDQVLVVQPPQPEDEGMPMNFVRRQLSADTLRTLRELPGCVSCDVLHVVPVPATLRIRMAGLLDNDQFIGIFSLDGALVPEELQDVWQASDGPVPMLLHPQVISLFNVALAERYHLPQISPELLTGASVTLEFGRDRFMSLPNPIDLPARFVGYHPLVPLWGVVIPQHRSEELLSQVTNQRPKGLDPLKPTSASPVKLTSSPPKHASHHWASV